MGFESLLEIVSELKRNFLSKTGLLIAVVCEMLLLVVLDPVLMGLGASGAVRGKVYCALFFCTCGAWYYLRVSFKKPSKNKESIVLAIRTENDRQKKRLVEDFAKRIGDLIHSSGLDSGLELIVLGEFHAQKYHELVSNTPFPEIFSVPAFSKILTSMKARLVINGNIKVRNDGGPSYFMDLDALLMHPELPKPLQNQLAQDMQAAWIKTYSFKEEQEYKGFEFSADFTFFAAQYYLAIYAAIVANTEVAKELLSKTILISHKDITQTPNIQKVIARAKSILSDVYRFSAIKEIRKKNFTKALSELGEAYTILPNAYGNFLTRAIIQFLYQNDIDGALASIVEAKKLAGADHAWKYSKAFLLIQSGKIGEGLKTYEEMRNATCEGEIKSIVPDVIEFNESLLKERPTAIRSLFIIGLIYFMKSPTSEEPDNPIPNFPLALEYFEKYEELARDKIEETELLREARLRIQQIKLELKII